MFGHIEFLCVRTTAARKDQAASFLQSSFTSVPGCRLISQEEPQWTLDLLIVKTSSQKVPVGETVCSQLNQHLGVGRKQNTTHTNSPDWRTQFTRLAVGGVLMAATLYNLCLRAAERLIIDWHSAVPFRFSAATSPVLPRHLYSHCLKFKDTRFLAESTVSSVTFREWDEGLQRLCKIHISC